MGTTRRRAGSLGLEVEGYRGWLADLGYTPQTVRNMLKDLGQVGRWLGTSGLTVEELDEHKVAAFLADRQVAVKRRALGPRGLAPLLAYLRMVGVAPEAWPSLAPLDVLLGHDRAWMLSERGLADSTCCATRTLRAASYASRQSAMAC
jgi:hypothetical protein